MLGFLNLFSPLKCYVYTYMYNVPRAVFDIL